MKSDQLLRKGAMMFCLIEEGCYGHTIHRKHKISWTLISKRILTFEKEGLIKRDFLRRGKKIVNKREKLIYLTEKGKAVQKLLINVFGFFDGANNVD